MENFPPAQVQRCVTLLWRGLVVGPFLFMSSREDLFSETLLGLAAQNNANSGIGVTPRPVLLKLLSLLEVLVFIPGRFSHLFRCPGNH
jgi:hypothetical protein